ncbi:MAG: thiamine pyrophosphate-dependent enzyme [Rhodospirillales bacterium]|jgi:phosphonopyruvate decarboxylase
MADKKLPSRKDAVPKLVGNHEDFLIVTGLAGPAKDMAHLTDQAPHAYMLGGAMGGALSMALGLALVQPDKKVLCVTGDGELLMNMSSLATIGVVQPPNLSVICVDNGHYQETGNQESHTNLGVDLEKVAQGCNIAVTRTVESLEECEETSPVLRNTNGPVFVLLRVNEDEPPKSKRNWDAADRKNVFRAALLGSHY